MVAAEPNTVFKSTEGSTVEAYYENKDLKILKIAIYGEMGRFKLFYYPIEDILAVVKNTIQYSQHLYWDEDTLIEYPSQQKMIIKDGQLYYFVDSNEPMYTSDNTWYAEAYEKAVAALNDADANS